ncbi:hypothetical protein CRG98_011950 [Punica granatum]|uniref:Uncharacterized protein n=1 Tax=Punica granatum TaxID=22663 RepID=A0A2I0KGT7_PUNGR|nr:hypothetical protein CRG98_011950 [Punica granatum]
MTQQQRQELKLTGEEIGRPLLKVLLGVSRKPREFGGEEDCGEKNIMKKKYEGRGELGRGFISLKIGALEEKRDLSCSSSSWDEEREYTHISFSLHYEIYYYQYVPTDVLRFWADIDECCCLSIVFIDGS